MVSPDNHLYEFKPFALDAASRTLFKNNEIVHLTPKAVETLLVLVQHRVQVVEKEQMLKKVWPDSFVEEGSLSRNIHELRKALGDDSSEPSYIETIPKRGYRFLAPLKVSVLDAGQNVPANVVGETTVIEKHTYARVLSEEFEVPLETPVAALNPAPIPKSNSILVGIAVVALLLPAAVGIVVYLKRSARSSAPTS